MSRLEIFYYSYIAQADADISLPITAGAFCG
jgi:hypothetical protein